jgi:K+-sensing histidine kinase KdpD
MRSPSRVRLAQLVGLALLAALAVLPVKSALNGALGRDVGFLPAVAAVVVAAGLGGFLPGLVATGVSIVLEAYVFMDPGGRLDVAVESDRVRLLLFGLVGLLASTLAWLRDRAQDDSHRARAEAEVAKERTDLIVRRLSALQGLAAELAGALTRDHLTNALLSHGIASLQADGAVVFYIDPGGEHLDAIGSRGYSRAGEQAMSILPLDVRTPATDVARTGEPVFIEDPSEYAARYGPSLASHGIEVLLHSVAAVPLAIDGRNFGVLGFTWDSPHEFAEDRREFIAAIARLGAAALERARLSSAEIAHASELEAVIGALGEGIVVIEPDGSVRSDNAAAARLLGGRVASLADLLGNLRDAGGNAPSEPPMSPTEFQLRARRDTFVEIVAYPVAGPQGTSPPTMVVVCRDTTAFRQGQGLREAFLSLLSHELRTPVTTIYGGSSVLTRPGASLSQETRSEILSDIAGEANRLYRLVEDLLVLARFDEGIDLGGEPSLLQRLVPLVVEQERTRWPAIRFAVAVGPDLPAVRADETSVQQVLRNLLSNAAKYSDVDSVVDVTVEAVPGGVAMRVRDHGAGVDANEAESLFEPFYRSPKTAKMAGGAGIGLYVSRRLVDAMDGRIWAAPAEGGGSEFTVVLPLYEGEFSD